MGERLNALQLLTARFFLCIAIGWFGFASLRTYLNVHHHDELRDAPYHPNIIIGQTMAAVGGVFLFCWTLSTLSAVCFAHGGTLMVIELVDGVGLVILTVAIVLQSTYLPKLPGQCSNALSWQVPSDKSSLFTILSGSEDHAGKLCKTMVLSWGFSIGVLVSFWLSAIHNFILSIKEFGTADCYWIHDFGGNKRSFGIIVVLLCLPLFIIEYFLELLWTMIPHKTKVWFRYRRQQKRKHRRYKDLESKLRSPADSKTLAPPAAFDLEVVHAAKNPRGTPYLMNQSFESAVKAISRITFAERTYTPALHQMTIISDHVFLKNQTPQSNSLFLAQLPWHLIINDLLPYLHYTDVLHLLLTSRTTYKAILPSDCIDRHILHQQTCKDIGLKAYWARNYGGPSRFSCFGCSTQVCSSCSTRRELSETPITTHIRTCKPVCTPCFQTVLDQPLSYGDRQWSRGCNCNHNRLVYSACANDELCTTTDTDSAPFLSRWSWATQGGKRWRDLCNTCTRLSNAEVKRKREERMRRLHQHQPGWELDEKGNRGAFTCGKCREKITVTDWKVPVLWFVCQICSKECRYAMHDQWVVEDAVAKGMTGVGGDTGP